MCYLKVQTTFVTASLTALTHYWYTHAETKITQQSVLSDNVNSGIWFSARPVCQALWIIDPRNRKLSSCCKSSEHFHQLHVDETLDCFWIVSLGEMPISLPLMQHTWGCWEDIRVGVVLSSDETKWVRCLTCNNKIKTRTCLGLEPIMCHSQDDSKTTDLCGLVRAVKLGWNSKQNKTCTILSL